MTTEELETSILGYMNDLYQAEFVGTIKVTPFPEPISYFDEPITTGYSVSLGITNYMIPIVLSHDDPDKFLDFVKEEIRVRNYMREDRNRTIKTPSYQPEI